MRIDSITVQNFLGVPNFRHRLAAPFLFVAGANGAGKSSLQDAIRFALTGELARGVALVKDRGKLITDGAAAGFVELGLDGYVMRRNIGSGKAEGDNPYEVTDALGLCLDPPRFAALPEADRRRILFALARVHANKETVLAELRDTGLSEDTIDKLLANLRNGFPEAAKYANKQASEARGAWKAITNEAYGSQKAEGWAPPTTQDPPTPDELERARDAVRRSEARIGALREAKGRADAAPTAEKLGDLRALAARAEDLRAAQAEAEAAYAEANTTWQALERQQRAAAHEETTTPCPHCQQPVVVHVDRTLALPGTKVKGPKASETTAAKKAYEAAHNTLLTARSAAQNAEVALATLDALPAEPSAEDRAAAGQLAEELPRLELHRAALRLLEDAERSAEANRGKAERAAKAHEDVNQWVLAEAKMGPDGIPAVLLARALDPVNALLAGLAESAGFKPVRIENDLRLTYGGRDFALCSESEQWRFNAVFAIAAAVLSEYRIVLLDRFDVLEPGCRGEVVDWLLALTDGSGPTAPALSTAIVAGTLKGKPDLGAGIDTVWLGEAA